MKKIVLLLLLGLSSASAREKLSFNPGWTFQWGDPEAATTVGFDDSDWYGVNLPHTVRVEPIMCSGNNNYQGRAVYRKRFVLPETYAGKKVFIEFEAVMQEAEVWVNGRLVMTHEGGYTPFTIDITDRCPADGITENLIVLRVDNSDNPDIPPGKKQNLLDFCYLGGIYRDAWIHVTDPVHITDAVYANIPAGGGVFVTYENVSAQSADVKVKTHIFNESDAAASLELMSELIDANGETAATVSTPLNLDSLADTHLEQGLTVVSPNLWHPDDPKLYTLRSTVLRDGSPVDVVDTRIGIRWIEFNTTDGFKINGERVALNGWNRHQEYAYIGNALPDSLHVKDVIKMRNAGFNHCRIGHYPHDPAFMDACDEMGMTTVVPAPGWHFYSESPRFLANAYQNIRDMIRRDRNRPGVILWEPLLNETAVPAEFAQQCYDVVHEEYPGEQCYAGADQWMGPDYDVIYGWQTRDGKPSMSREYGDGLEHNYSEAERYDPDIKHYRACRGTNHFYCGGELGMLWSCRDREFRGVSSLNGHWGLWHQNEGFAGMSLWAGIDHNRGYVGNLGAVGILDLLRLPKFTYYLYQSQRDPELDFSSFGVDALEYGPMVFIANYWTENSSRDVKVFSNAEEVRLFLNGELVGTQAPAEGAHPHPSFLFTNVTWQAGTLKAEALIGGSVVAEHEVNTPGEPAYIELIPDAMDLDFVADGSDILTVYAYVKDADGNVCPEAYHNIRFGISGEGRIIGDEGDERVMANPVDAEAGIIGVLVQSTREAGTITLTAASDGLNSGNLVMTTVSNQVPEIAGILPGSMQSAPSTPINELADDEIYLAELTPLDGSSVHTNENAAGTDLMINGVKYTHGLSMFAPHEVVYELGGQYIEFNAIIGVDDHSQDEGPVNFEVWVDGKNVYRSDKTYHGPLGKHMMGAVSADIRGAQQLTLLTEVTTNGVGTPMVDWINARLKKKPPIEINPANVVQGKVTSASTQQEGHPPELAIDESLNTYWIATTAASPQWWQVDLGESMNLTGAKILWGNDRTYYTYTIQTSSDAQQWTTVYEGVRSGQDIEPDMFSQEDVRYLRIHVTDVNGPGNYAQIWDVKVFADFSWLSEIQWDSESSGWAGNPSQTDLSVEKKTLTVNGQTFPKGVGTHAAAEIVYALDSQFSVFTCRVGIDDETEGRGSVVFKVLGDGTLLYDSGQMTPASGLKPVNVSVLGVKELKLVVEDAGDGIGYDHADWVDARLFALGSAGVIHSAAFVEEAGGAHHNLSELGGSDWVIWNTALDNTDPVVINSKTGGEAFDGLVLTDDTGITRIAWSASHTYEYNDGIDPVSTNDPTAYGCGLFGTLADWTNGSANIEFTVTATDTNRQILTFFAVQQNMGSQIITTLGAAPSVVNNLPAIDGDSMTVYRYAIDFTPDRIGETLTVRIQSDGTGKMSDRWDSIRISGAVLAVLAAPPVFTEISASGRGLAFGWSSRDGKTYDLESTESLVNTNWFVYQGYSNMPAIPPLNSLEGIPVDGPIRFFRIIEK